MSNQATHNFDNIAFAYDTFASWVFGKSIQQSQAATLFFIPEGATVLIIGGGSGWYLRELLLHKKLYKIVYIEASENMISLTRKKIQPLLSDNKSLLDIRIGTEDTIYPHEKFDVIITHFFLDIFAPTLLQKIANRLNQALRPDGLWLIADFRLRRQSGLGRNLWMKVIVNSMYLFFRITCRISAKELPDFEQLFDKMNMGRVYERTFNGLLFAAVYTRK